jgi:hypothetical protein
MTARRARTEKDAPASGAGTASALDDASAVSARARAAGVRLARLHLRLGSPALARAQLESYASGGSLDAGAMVDLAEARWRTGDLAGAGVSAQAAIGHRTKDPLAFVIAAEAVAEAGRPTEARRLAGRAVTAAAGPLDALFAGMPRSSIWPADSIGAESAPPVAAAPRVGRSRPGRGASEDAGPAPTAAAEAFAGGRGALASGDVATAALELGVAIRLEPDYAQAALDAIGERIAEPRLALVAGDALRLLGRETEALAAFDTARGRSSPVGPSPAEPAAGDAGEDADDDRGEDLGSA